eukprot:2769934-Alexandrium_andersonii.AAC.1
MSASLVGSEMCIRDSCEGRPRGRLCCGFLGGVRGCTRVASGMLSCSSSVSYTHLTLPTICSV